MARLSYERQKNSEVRWGGEPVKWPNFPPAVQFGPSCVGNMVHQKRPKRCRRTTERATYRDKSFAGGDHAISGRRKKRGPGPNGGQKTHLNAIRRKLLGGKVELNTKTRRAGGGTFNKGHDGGKC